MQILNRNIDRLKHHRRKGEMEELIEGYEADVVVLTEADTRLQLKGYPYTTSTEPLEQTYYKTTERRVMVYSKFPILGEVATYDAQTACCPLLETNLGITALYGTVLGIYGNRKPPFKEDLISQIADWKEISQTYALTVVGDLNMSFTDNYYYTEYGREMLLAAFEDCDLKNITRNIPNNIDHVLISNALLMRNPEQYTMCMAIHTKKTLSDHMGIIAGTTTLE